MSLLPELIRHVYDSPLATAIRESNNLFPILQTFHIVGTILLAGAIAIVDLTLLGTLFRSTAPATLTRSLLPLTWLGFGVMLISGGLLFIAQSARIYTNVFLQLKLGLLAVALFNVGLFHATTFRHASRWQNASDAPASAKAFAAISLVSWTAVIVTGRFIAYF
ncbi:hypothetical protein [Steroidobacter sp.]|uniref:hypothetical protein n=1 Tax=Steroidobacter sp. TaxID=1978227 RepID=UPI001A3EDB92|nr:hypothetical protein [Steroidobacter sp.]MBL8266109.1 hypothetical protein [Steroidobacter sp.]